MTSARSARNPALRLRRLLLVGALVAAITGIFVGGFLLGSRIGVDTVKQTIKAVVDPASAPRKPPGAWKVVPSMLHDVVIERHALPESQRTGGAIEQVAGRLVFATPDGHLGYLGADDSPHMLTVDVPMNNEGLRHDPIVDNPAFDIQYIRVTDLLARPLGRNRFQLLVSHHRYHDGCVDLRVSAVTLEASDGQLTATADEMHPVFVAEPCMGFRPDNEEFVFSGHQAGGRMIRYGNDQVLLSVGDHQYDGTHGMGEGMAASLPRERAFTTDPRVSLGKVLVLDPDTGAHRIFAVGVRNPQGLLRDDENRIWETEHGPQGGDELNLIEHGQNYGWPEVTLGVDYGPRPWPFNPAQGRHRGFTKPRYAWVPSVGVSNLVEVRGNEFPSWRGDLLVTSLIGMTVYRLRLDEDHVVYAEPLQIGERVRDIIVLEDGRVALYADSANAVLVLANEDGTGHTRASQSTDDAEPGPHGSVEQPDSDGARVFQANCASCHSLRGETGVGPPLEGVTDRNVGAARGFAYSAALRAADRRWSDERLREFLRAPQTVFPGSRMTAMQLTEAELDALMAFLAAQKRS